MAMAVSEWVPVARVGDVEPGEGFRVEIDEQPIAIWNVDGQYYATSDACTHEETSLVDGDLWGEVIECPLHGAQFDVRTGEVVSLPAVFPLPTYPVKVEDGVLYVGWRDPE
jgi:3-phenylpropionate/trans-cinnamate dioxygenase ferredoxin subunit